jgi:hypothetical protein
MPFLFFSSHIEVDRHPHVAVRETMGKSCIRVAAIDRAPAPPITAADSA